METIIGKLDQIENKYYVIKRIIVKMVLILEVMHRNGVIHRDLKVYYLLFSQETFFLRRTVRSNWLISGLHLRRILFFLLKLQQRSSNIDLFQRKSKLKRWKVQTNLNNYQLSNLQHQEGRLLWGLHFTWHHSCWKRIFQVLSLTYGR